MNYIEKSRCLHTKNKALAVNCNVHVVACSISQNLLARAKEHT